MARIQQPLATPKNQRPHPEHDFTQSFSSWEASVFDNAAYFSALTFPDRTRQEFPTFAKAYQYAQQTPRTCLYAVTKSGRSTHLDEPAWAAWLARAQEQQYGNS